ncbi:DeoR/GlpR transcriptional regulator [Rhizobium sp. TH2]|uniref:DeoR/GlpR family DNA-binding transcription regulator n=1 Tax=Rhizobium sp. TH2 TaxID=2775403 RepID=UPI002157D7B8|nr:DeoR/GlpR family DNA-binding transcription regulator [Rhizobium sp. TH2]UVC09458.1 DeoR/GlpR transcriptional regulator [Rhizobium sp. TH2]
MDTSYQPGESLVGVIARDMPDLNKAFRRIGAYIIASPDRFMHKPLQEIARESNVSEPTVVRFCRHYGFKGVPDFRIALAMSLARQSPVAGSSFIEPGVSDKAVMNLDQKKAIARFAAALAGTDRSIIVDSGSTTQLFASRLREAPAMVIMTTGLNVVETLRGAPQHTVMLPAGAIRFESNSVSGRLVESTLANMRFDTLYLGADSIDPLLGLSTYNIDEAHQNTAMINVSQRVVVLADSTKFRTPALHRFCEIDRIHTIVTDTGLSDEIAEQLSAGGVTVHRIDPHGGDQP